MGDKKIHIFREVSFYNQFHSDEDVVVTVLRNGKEKDRYTDSEDGQRTGI